MEIAVSLVLGLAAFLLGACPFAVLIGRKVLAKDIRKYGDGNPGAYNVFRAGGVIPGMAAVILDIAKGIPFVWLGYMIGLPFNNLLFIAVCAVLGHAFSPFLKFKGGKAIAVTFGVLIALPQTELLFLFVVFMFIAFLLIEQHSWVVMMGPTGTALSLILYSGFTLELAFVLFILILYLGKQHKELDKAPAFRISIKKRHHREEGRTNTNKQEL
ncbi:MAG: glycerol-3-phosphate acyltransferase [Dehalococcoidales bacterium]